MSKTHAISSLVEWFRKNKRSFPWRNNATSYHVWISEIMLQQTQASVVVGYFERFLKKFPTLRDLAEAPQSEVIKAWEGLGYYSRARNLHAGAQYVLEKHAGNLPQDEESLSKIKGLGPYTIGAIQSFAFKKKAAAVDGNVLRVLARYFAIDEDITQMKTQKYIRDLTLQLLPDESPWEAMEAFIELGALVCKKTPLCTECPLRSECKAYQMKMEGSFPIKRKGAPTQTLTRIVFLIRHEGKFLVKKAGAQEIMADLYEFPYEEIGESDITEILNYPLRKLPLSVKAVRSLEPQKHSFTRFRATLYPILCVADLKPDIENYEWVTLENMEKLPFSSGHKRILKQLKVHDENITY